jgi:RNA polymerase sigma factor for flagellar operon FliA
VREKSKKIEEAYASLRENLFREPTYQEISDKLELSPEKVGEYLSAAHIYNMVSLEELLTDQMESFSMGENSNQGPQFLLLKKELSNVLGKAVDGLSEKERLVISLFYYEDLKIKDIAKIMEITPSRVSQIHSLALTKMKVKINEYFKA